MVMATGGDQNSALASKRELAKSNCQIVTGKWARSAAFALLDDFVVIGLRVLALGTYIMLTYAGEIATGREQLSTLQFSIVLPIDTMVLMIRY